MSYSLCYDGYNQRAYEEVSMTMRSAMSETEGNDADPKVAYGFINDAQTGFPIMTETAQTQKNGTAPGHESGVMQTIGFKAGQSKDGGLGDEREVSPTLSHQPSALEPTVATQTGEQVNATHKTNPGEILRLLRETLGEKAFQEWRIGINAKLQQEEVLQHKMRGQRPFGETAHGDELGGYSLPCAKDCPIGALCPMRKTECIGCSPQRRESAEQQPIQSNSTLPKLSYPYSPTEGQMCDLWQTDEGAWILQQALDKISQIRESVMVQRQRGIGGILAAMRYIVRRLTPKEAERLMGLPDGHTIPTGLRRFFDANGEPSPELVAEFQRIHDTFGAIMADYAHAKPPKGKSYNQVVAWLKKISDPATCPDSPRYKGCGNGWATNQPRWILTRMLSMEGIEW